MTIEVVSEETGVIQTNDRQAAGDFLTDLAMEAFENLQPGEFTTVSVLDTKTGDTVVLVGLGGITADDASRGAAVLAELSSQGFIPSPSKGKVKSMEVLPAPFGCVVALTA